jgi:hypothetical protein
LTILVGLLAWAVQLFGMIGMALLVGQTATAAVQRPRDSALEHILIGGILLGLVRILPFLGWIEFIPLSFWYDAPLTSQYSARRHNPWLVDGSPRYRPARWSAWIAPA